MKNSLKLIILYILITVSILQNWLFVSVILILFYSFNFGAISLVPLAILLDGYFGKFYSFPLLSLLSIIWSLLVLQLEPVLVNINTSDSYESIT